MSLLFVFHHTARVSAALPQSIREMVTQKYERQEELLTNIIKQQQVKVDDHLSGRKLLDEEEFAHHQRHIQGLQRKLYATKQKDPQVSSSTS
mmetsp:Transcript_5107/g.9279  ORF Transcript_5107/g.9279 Transcript_5107/m.9279 type:complete len:92 (+) Transcript_5107:232-507(+)